MSNSRTFDNLTVQMRRFLWTKVDTRCRCAVRMTLVSLPPTVNTPLLRAFTAKWRQSNRGREDGVRRSDKLEDMSARPEVGVTDARRDTS